VLALEGIRSKTREIRYLLGRQVGSLMRLVPDLEFYEDDSLDYIDNIDKLLHQ
jgi:ribosome-binding factor A